ncbi:hypothetical protein DICPUDRAFT_148184 [Dictyostelium purpureum]|uniref:FNIP repeat-containing protein n=1 Tax=Dictyostelium purpureum TaxID=5786 RepID=F0ZAG8_DICPU|nr:uncharacterized protein DICPUDRAFT_148184 [Dictyostelium purpureum]EGC39049.1 hypothetical protein DICPUDRAFT_148184 [Dictyostelium purpureum]|eukprot:XP_003284399.1 hypothetical protein DICPUDRAFT_148184 [Dictyostelium purpureum]
MNNEIFNINNINNDNNNNDKLFFKVWRNILIKREIKKHLDLYRIYYRVTAESKSCLLNVNRNYISILEYGFDEFIDIDLIPPSVTTLEFCNWFNQPIVKGAIPDSVNRIVFGFTYNQPVIVGAIPCSVQNISFDELFNQTITKGCIPPSVHTLKFGTRFNKYIAPLVLPPSITKLVFGYEYNHSLENSIPSSITTLSLGQSFQLCKYGSNLPDSITSFTCSYNFDKPLESNNNIPKKVLYLTLDNYNHPIIKDSIPSTCHTLILGSEFRHFESLSNLSSSVSSLTFGVKDCQLSNYQIKQYISKTISKIEIKRN